MAARKKSFTQDERRQLAELSKRLSAGELALLNRSLGQIAELPAEKRKALAREIGELLKRRRLS